MSSDHLNAELLGLKNIRMEWVKKRDALRLEEVKQSDPNTLHSIKSNLEDIIAKVKSFDLEISLIEDKLNSTKENASLDLNKSGKTVTIVEDENIAKAIAVLKQEAKELNYNSTKEDFAKIHNLKTKVFEDVFKNLDNQLNFVASKKELMYSSVLFDTIYGKEVLDQVTITEIQKIRGDRENYKWFDRSVIVSALSLSLIHFKFDFKRANLLLDFVTDFETNVWQRALTGLTIAIIYQKNRSWLRDTNFTNRLKTLQSNTEIQKGLKAIDFILRNELYKSNLYNPRIFELDLFKNPMNCFVPFYENNEILKNALNDANSDFNTEEFRHYLEKMPIMDSYKYMLCISLSNGGLKKQKVKNDDAKKIIDSLTISDNFSPYQNLISEFYFFFNHFPEKLKDDVFKKQLLIIKTELKNYVLNKVLQMLLEANMLYREKLYQEAINKYRDLIKIDKSNLDARWQLGNCYLAKNSDKEALPIFLELEKDTKEKINPQLFILIALCYRHQKKYSKSNEYCGKNEEKDKDPNITCLFLKAENFYKLGDYPNAYLYCKKAENKIGDAEDIFDIADLYSEIEKYDDALRMIKEAIKADPKIAKYRTTEGTIYSYLFEWDLSMASLTKANELDKKESLIDISIARNYLFSKRDLTKAKEIFEKLLRPKFECVEIAYGNLGHFYFINGDKEAAFEKYFKCVTLLKDEKDFRRRMELDLRFLVNFGITELEYNQMKESVIDKFMSSK